MRYRLSQFFYWLRGGDNINYFFKFLIPQLLEYFNNDTQYKIEVPNTATSIGNYAFNGMVLITEVHVPDSVESIGEGAFDGCNSIEKITLPFVGASENSTGYQSVFGYIFGYNVPTNSYNYLTSGGKGTAQHYTRPYNPDYSYSNYYTALYHIPQTLVDVTISTQVNIPSYAFKNCDLIETITLLETVESIGEYAFYNCNATINYTYIPQISSIWDGSIASSYHSGSGTTDDPYIIFTASEFAYFAEQVNSGNSYDYTYFKLSSNIRLANKEFNSFQRWCRKETIFKQRQLC